MTTTWAAALIAAAREFPIGTRVIAPDGKTGTVIDAGNHTVARSSHYNTSGSAFVRPSAFKSGLGGPYIAINFDGSGASDRAADTLVKVDSLATPETIIVNVTVIINS